MKVCVIGSRGIQYQYSGIENALKELLPRIESDGQIKFVVYGYNLGDKSENFELVKHVLIPAIVWKNGGNAFATLYAFIHSLLFQKASCYVFFASGPSIFSIITWLLRIPTISAIRAIDSQREKWNKFQSNVLKAGESIALRFSTVTTVNSLHMKEYFSNFNTVYIPNGYSNCDKGRDSELVRYNLYPKKYLLYAARLVPEKRPDLLIKAFLQFKLSNEGDMKLVIAGGQESSKSYLEYLKEISSDKVLFLGHLTKSQLNPIMRNSLIFIHPSILEGMSNSLLSAMSSNVACLCTDIPENRAISPYEDIFFEKDNISELASKISFFARNEKYRLDLAQNLKSHIESNFSWDESADQYKNLILSIL